MIFEIFPHLCTNLRRFPRRARKHGKHHRNLEKSAHFPPSFGALQPKNANAHESRIDNPTRTGYAEHENGGVER
jgi:hypothetical protein